MYISSRKSSTTLSFSLLLLVVSGSAIVAQSNSETRLGKVDASSSTGQRTSPSITAQRIETAPILDGILDDDVWQLSTIVDNFYQQEPIEGAPATERTEVRILHDETALYFGVTAYDSEPDGLVASEMRRDAEQLFEEDNFQIILDTFHDLRSGYMFVTNPLGGKLEQQVAEEGEGGFGRKSPNVNVDWDGVWHVATTQFQGGWIAEIAIPMVTLRFPKMDEQVWGINFMRNIRRKNEQVFWAPIPKAYTLTRVSLAGTLNGIRQVNRGLDLRITPYVLAGLSQKRITSGLTTSGFGDIGMDVKYGVASGLNLDLTLNTDFAQVEVDEQQVNLTRFPLFFPEKRDFFLENAGMFQVGSGGFGRTIDLFFTRRIGLSEQGQPIPIIGGGRLTGKVDRHNVAVMTLQTQNHSGLPSENFFVTRYSRDILARSKIGGLIVNKEATGTADYNRTFAADTTLALHQNFTVTGLIAKTETPGISTGQMAGDVRGTWKSPSWHIQAGYSDIQDHFNPEVGFVPRTGIRTSNLHLEWDPRPGKWNIRRLDPMFNIRYITDQHNRLVTRWIHNMVGTYFENDASVTVWYNDHFEQLDFSFPIRSDVTIPAGTYRFGEWNFQYRSDPSQRFYQKFQYSPQGFFGGNRTDWSVTLGLRPTASVSTEGEFKRSDVTGPWGSFVADLAQLRIDVNVSPEMTLRTLTQYNSTTQSVSTSVRFNWIYRPGSDIYIAYDEMRLDGDPLLYNLHIRRSPWLQNRQLAIKMTYLFSM